MSACRDTRQGKVHGWGMGDGGWGMGDGGRGQDVGGP